ncbi:MAG: CehA/McbA family metallohydrolase [Candidatus Bathyarchaeia archaeon]
MKLKLDLHVHTHYSYDSLITPEELVAYAKKKGLDGVAITDHERLDSAQKIAKQTDFFIIPGMEIASKHGHIVALNLKEPVPKGLTAEETVSKIHEAGGIAVACHPITFFKGSLGRHADAKFDAIEVINSTAFPFHYSVKKARQLALRLNTPQVGGTDAHYAPQIGYAYTLVEADLQVDSVIKAIQQRLSQPFGSAIPLTLRLKKELLLWTRWMH